MTVLRAQALASDLRPTSSTAMYMWVRMMAVILNWKLRVIAEVKERVSQSQDISRERLHLP